MQRQAESNSFFLRTLFLRNVYKQHSCFLFLSSSCSVPNGHLLLKNWTRNIYVAGKRPLICLGNEMTQLCYSVLNLETLIYSSNIRAWYQVL